MLAQPRLAGACDRVGVRLSPYGVANGSGEPDRVAQVVRPVVRVEIRRVARVVQADVVLVLSDMTLDANGSIVPPSEDDEAMLAAYLLLLSLGRSPPP